MAIKGAFGAGFVKGFGESMKDNADKRFAQQERYVDNMMENARRLAPKYMQDKATADSAIDLMNEFQDRYGVTNEEFIALYQTHDVAEVYKMIQSEEAGLRPKQQLDVRKNILSALNIPKGTKLPDGMSAEEAVRSMILGYAQNLETKPGDASEAHKNNSWAKAISSVLSLNPRASAEEQIAGMQVAGVPVQEILQYQAMQGAKYKPLEGVSRGGVLSFDDGYEAGDYDQTVKSYQSAFRFTFAKTDDLSTLVEGATQTTEALNRIGAANTSELATKIYQGGIAMANLELALANTGVKEVSRDVALRTLSAEVTTAEQFNNMQSAIKSGLAADLIRESLDKHGTLTEEYVNLILQNKPKEEPKGGQEIIVAPGADVGAAVAAQMAAGAGGEPVVADPVKLDMTGAPGFRERDDIATQTEAAIPEAKPVDPALTNANIVSGLVTPEVAPTTATIKEPTADAVPKVSAPIEEKISAPTVQNVNDSFVDTEEKDLSVEDQVEKRYQAVQSFLDEASAVAGETTETAMQAVANVIDIADRAALKGTFKVGTKLATAVGATAQHMGYDDTAKAWYKWSIENKDSGTTTPLLTQQINDLLDNLGWADYSEGINLPSPDTEMGGAGPILGAIPLADMTADFISSLNQEESAEVLVKEIFDDVAAMSEEEKAAKIEELKAVAAALKNSNYASEMEERIRDDARQFAQDRRSYPQPLDRIIIEKDQEEEERDVNREAAMLYGRAQDTEMGGGTFSSDAESANMIQDVREPEMISYEEWKDMSKADRKKIGLDLSLVAIQNRTRGGRIPIPEGFSLPARLRMKQPENRATPKAEGKPRVPADEAIMTRPTKQDLTSPTTEGSISVERSTGPSKALADLRTTFNRIHGKKSKASKQLEKVLREAQSGTPIQYTDVNQLLRITRSLPKTKTRDDLAAKLYDLAQGLR